MPPAIDVRPATWDGFESVMGEKGGCGGCWCMLWRQSAKAMAAGQGDGNRHAMQTRFDAPVPSGVIAWSDETPVGWLQIASRGEFPRLETSRVLQPVDNAPVWSVTCFLVDKRWRRHGVSKALLDGACAFARKQGATIVEGYPVAPSKTPYPSVYAWVGFASTFLKAGFQEVARRSPTRPIMRRHLGGDSHDG